MGTDTRRARRDAQDAGRRALERRPRHLGRAVGPGEEQRAAGAGPAAPSTRFTRTANPPTPSASTWWNTTIRAQASPSRPVTSVADHSGWSGGSGCVTAPAATRRRDSSSPGGGQRTSWTCPVISNSGSSTHTGRPQPGGVDTSRWRKREMPRIRSASASRTPLAARFAPGANTRIAPTWSGTGPTSEASSIMSIELARSTRSSSAPCSSSTTDSIPSRHRGRTTIPGSFTTSR